MLKHFGRSRLIPALWAAIVGIGLPIVAIAADSSGDENSAGLIRHGNQISVPQNSPYRSRLVVKSVETALLKRPLVVPATIEADPAKTVKLLPPLSGRLIALKAGLGDAVTEGEVLAIIESPDLAQAYDDDAKAASVLDLAQHAYDRQRGVTGIGVGSAKDLEGAKDALTQAEAEHRRTEARLKIIGQFADPKDASRNLIVRAPVSGTITELDIADGSYINDPAQSLMTISALDSVFVTASVAENDMAAVAVGDEAAIRFIAYPNENFTAKVKAISAVLEPDTHRTKVRLAFANPAGRFKPNMYATVTFMRPEIPQLFVPTSALLMNNDQTTVFVETAPWTFERRAIDLEYQAGDDVTILNGLALGERVVVKGGVLLND